jgi:hypothetical protein
MQMHGKVTVVGVAIATITPEDITQEADNPIKD